MKYYRGGQGEGGRRVQDAFERILYSPRGLNMERGKNGGEGGPSMQNFTEKKKTLIYYCLSKERGEGR